MFFRTNIEKLERKGDLDALIGVLEHKDPSVRDGAVAALGRSGCPRAVEPLIEALQLRMSEVNGRWVDLSAPKILGRPDPTEERKRAIHDAEQAAKRVVYALAPFAESGDLRAIAALVPYGDEEHKPWGPKASSVLAGCRDFDLLRNALASPDLPDLETVSVYRGDFDKGGTSMTLTSSVRPWAARRLGELSDARAVEPLVRALEDGSVGSQASTALDKLGPIAVEPLIGLLDDDDAHIRGGAVRILGRLGDARAVEPLVELLEDDDPGVRANAVHALDALDDPRAADPLIARLGDDSPQVRRTAVQAIDKLSDPRATEPLIGLLGDDDAHIRGSAVQILGKLGDARAVEPLIGALADSDGEVGYRAAVALGRLGDQRAVEPLIRSFTSEGRGFKVEPVYRALERIGGKRAKEAITHDAPRVGDRVDVRITEWREVGMPGDRTDVVVGVGSWTGTVLSVSPDGGRATVHPGSAEGEAQKPGEDIEMTLHESEATELPEDDGHWRYEVYHGPRP